MGKNLIAKASISINASSEKVWNALVTPESIKQYMFGTNVVSDWREGSQIIWKGEWQGKPYEDKGKILQFKPKQKLQYSHFSPPSGVPDKPENYHTVTVELSTDGNQTRVHAAYPGRTWERLAAIKARYDPTNLFHLNQNISPTGK